MYNLFEAKLFLAYSIDTNIIKFSSIYRSIHYKIRFYYTSIMKYNLKYNLTKYIVIITITYRCIITHIHNVIYN